jgi:hypothetical protein
LFDSAPSLAQRSDIARYELLLRYGGVYVDTDFECLRCLEDLLCGLEAFVGTENGEHLTNSLIGSIPGHPLIGEIVEAIPKSIAANPQGLVNQTTGPSLLTAVVNAHPDLCEGLRVFDAEIFYPYLHNEIYRRGEEFQRAYAVHHWAGSWLSEPLRQMPPRYRIVVVADWDHPTAAVAVIPIFARLFGSKDPIELVLSLPKTPDDSDRRKAGELLDALAFDTGACAPVIQEAFSETSHQPYDVAVVPQGDGDLAVAVGRAIDWLYDVRGKIDRYGRPAVAATVGEQVLSGDTQVLGDLLAALSAPRASHMNRTERLWGYVRRNSAHRSGPS